MEKKGKIIFLISLVLFLLIINFKTFAEVNDEFISSKVSEKIRVAYVEGEPWIEFAGTFHSLIMGLEERGIISGVDNLPYQFGQHDSREMWDYLVENAQSDYLEFIEEAHYSFAIDEQGVKGKLLSHLSKGEYIDLVLSMGTYSGKVLAVDSHQVPILNFASSNAIFSEIIDSAEDSGKDHVWAHVDPGRYSRQVEVFYDIFEFDRLGIVYEDSDLGRAFADIAAVEEVAEINDFELVRRFVDEPYSYEEDRERYYSEVLVAHQELAKEVDATLIAIASIESDRLAKLMQAFYEQKIPTFSQLGAEEVEYGVLMTVGSSDFREIGQFGTEIVEEIISGALPRDLEQEFVVTPRIILNLEVADKIDYQIPFEILLVADEIYHEIGN